MLSSAKSESAAEQSVKDLKSAVTGCGSGFETSLPGPGRKVRYVVTQTGASLASISDEAEFPGKIVPVPQTTVDAQERLTSPGGHEVRQGRTGLHLPSCPVSAGARK